MKYNFSTRLTGLDGGILIDASGSKPVEVSLGLASANALMAPSQKLSGAECVARFMLASKVYQGGDVDVSPEDVADIRAAIAECGMLPPIAVARCWMLLDKPT